MNIFKKILQWVAIIFFAFMTLGSLLCTAPVSVFLLLLCTVFCIPKTQEFINKKVKIAFSVKIIATIVIFLIGVSALPNTGSIEETNVAVESQTVKNEMTAENVSEEANAEPETVTSSEEVSQESSEESGITEDETEPVSSTMEVHFIDVGQGDTTLIKCDDQAMLIDAGDDSKGTAIQNYLQKQGVTKLDYIILTHPDADHIGGAPVVITKFDIDTVFMSNYEKDNKSYMKLIQALDNKLLKWTTPKVGDTYSLGNASFTVIAPNGEYSDPNNSSVGIILKNGENKFLFTGDAEEEAEFDSVDNGIDISADVYQVGHHGSKTASSEKLLAAVKPEYAVLSCAEGNKYGHPHSKTLNSLRAMGVKVFRTDEQGSIIATSDGTNITWNCAPSETWQAGESTESAKVEESAKVAESANNKSEVVAAVPAQEETVAAPAPSSTDDIIVHITKTGECYHNAGCGSLSRSDMEVTLEKAKAKGLRPCERCDPPQ